MFLLWRWNESLSLKFYWKLQKKFIYWCRHFWWVICSFWNMQYVVFFPRSASASSARSVFALVSRFDTLPCCLSTVTELVYLEWSELSTAVLVMHHSSGHILPTLSICSRPVLCVCVRVCVCVCVRAYVKACISNPHPSTSDQVFSVTSAIPRGKGWSCMCVLVFMCHWWLCLSLMDCLWKRVTVWTLGNRVKSWVNWIDRHGIELNAL